MSRFLWFTVYNCLWHRFQLR